MNYITYKLTSVNTYTIKWTSKEEENIVEPILLCYVDTAMQIVQKWMLF